MRITIRVRAAVHRWIKIGFRIRRRRRFRFHHELVEGAIALGERDGPGEIFIHDGDDGGPRLYDERLVRGRRGDLLEIHRDRDDVGVAHSGIC